MIRRAAARGADVLVLDLEDGVHPRHKAGARAGIAAARETLEAEGARVMLRVHHPGSPCHALDLETAHAAGFRELLVSKAESLAGIHPACDTGARVHLMIETAPGAARVFELASAPGVAGIAFGAADYRLGIGVRGRSETLLQYARQRLLLAARAAGVSCWDAPWFAFRDSAGLRRRARAAAEMGFDGMLAVHPSQTPVIHEAFAASAEETAHARRVLEVMREADARGEAVAELDGELVEHLHARAARRLLARYGPD